MVAVLARSLSAGAAGIVLATVVGMCGTARARPIPSLRAPSGAEARAIAWKDQILDLGGDPVSFSDGYHSDLDEDGGCQVCMHIRTLDFGDVDGDGKEEALMAIGANLGGAGTSIWGYIFGVTNGKPVWRATIEGGDRGEGGVESLKVEGGMVIVRRFDAQVSDGLCCPSRVKVERWRWTDGRLEHVGRDRVVRRPRIPWFRWP